MNQFSKRFLCYLQTIVALGIHFFHKLTNNKKIKRHLKVPTSINLETKSRILIS